MGRCILKIPDGDRVWYLFWSAVVDAPVSRGMTLEQLRDYVREESGQSGLRDLPERLARCDGNGASWLEPGSDLAGTISGNRAGPRETELTLEQIVATYCREPEEAR